MLNIVILFKNFTNVYLILDTYKKKGIPSQNQPVISYGLGLETIKESIPHKHASILCPFRAKFPNPEIQRHLKCIEGWHIHQALMNHVEYEPMRCCMIYIYPAYGYLKLRACMPSRID